MDSNLRLHYWKDEKSEDYVFFNCSMAKQLRRRLRQSMGYSWTVTAMLQLELEWLMYIQTNFKVQQDVVKLTFAVFVYWLWCAHNEIIFNGKAFIVSSLYDLVRAEVQIKLQSQIYKNGRGT